MKILYILFLLINLSICDDQPSVNIVYKNVTLDLTLGSENTDEKVVPKKPDQEDVPTGFNKYVIYGTQRGYYFNVSDVVYNGETLKLGEEKVTQDYVYDVYTYWSNGRLLVFCFRYDYGNYRSKYKYYKLDNNEWKLVEGDDYQPDGYGKLTGNGLAGLLKKTETDNAPAPGPTEETKKDTETNTRTVVIIGSVVGGVLVVLLLGFLAFYLLKK
uniref:Uncharacterized protein n=1 Tax=Theileria annulata TaxID=5874 RepID=A0A3B0N9J6_THEAN